MKEIQYAWDLVAKKPVHLGCANPVSLYTCLACGEPLTLEKTWRNRIRFRHGHNVDTECDGTVPSESIEKLKAISEMRGIDYISVPNTILKRTFSVNNGELETGIKEATINTPTRIKINEINEHEWKPKDKIKGPTLLTEIGIIEVILKNTPSEEFAYEADTDENLVIEIALNNKPVGQSLISHIFSGYTPYLKWLIYPKAVET